jgi:hypothetical protein
MSLGGPNHFRFHFNLAMDTSSLLIVGSFHRKAIEGLNNRNLQDKLVNLHNVLV